MSTTKASTSNYDLVEDLIAHLALDAWLNAHLDDWQGASSGSGSGIQAGISNPTENGAIRHAENPSATDQLVDGANRFIAQLAEVKAAIGRLNAARHAIEPLRQQHLAHIERMRTTTGFCIACDRECDGSTAYLTLYRELCGGCRKALERRPSSSDPEKDREAFITEQRRRQKRVTGRR